jgi:hypothetical protein
MASSRLRSGFWLIGLLTMTNYSPEGKGISVQNFYLLFTFQDLPDGSDFFKLLND